MPWLKTVLAAFALATGVPAALSCAISGSPYPMVRAVMAIGAEPVEIIFGTYAWGALALAFVSLALNCIRPATVEGGRKARLVAWAFVVGMTPWLVLTAVAMIQGRNIWTFPFWVWAVPALALMLLPVIFAYAVVRHRVFEFSVLVRRSARYMLVQRGFALITVLLSVGVTAVFALYGARLLPRLTDAALPVGIAAGAAFGLAVVRTGGAVARRVTQRIDRAFFREAYDARRVLEDLSQKAREATSRPELASLLEAEIADAFHPREVAVYLTGPTGALDLVCGPENAPRALGPALPLMERLAQSGQAWSVPAPENPDARLVAPLAALSPDCLAPLPGRRGDIIGLLVLGPRLSEEPYGRDDRALLTSVTRQAGLALESLALAEAMAERIEAERRAEREVEIAAEVQRRMLPQRVRPMDSIECAGRCRQARAVGGDYYDFLDFGPGQLGVVLADVSGKGLYAALLMANLQASLRSLARQLADDMPAALQAVNRSFGESTAGDHYATLFLGHYDDGSRLLRYASCGHHPPFLLRDAGGVERLTVTAGAIGMFEPWPCQARDVVLMSGDLLVAFSDGVTETLDDTGQEFGEAGLLAVLQAHRHRPVADVVDAVIDAVLAFGGGDQQDDLTLVVARGR
jgi:sigma-B regulation protein RsbU (phosphoserine phosphatase)